VWIKDYPSTVGKAYVIAEIDGSMIPIVETDETAPDKRKGKKESRKEARLCEESNAPVRACHRYLSNRIGQLDYPTAKSLGLPVGRAK
jgi:hypothetical protein